MLTRIHWLLCTLLVCSSASTAIAQTSLAEFQKLLSANAAFEATDFAALELNQPVVRLAPVSDKREIAVSGAINIRAGAEDFLKSYREGMTRKNNPAILEIGSFGKEPALADLQNLTIEAQDIEDLKECVVGDCRIKLSAAMIERFRKEIDWQLPDYQLQVATLFKQLLLDYVRDYVARGEAALIEYNDKRDEMSLAAAQRALSQGYLNGVLTDKQSDLRVVEDAIVWSKLKFGLKPVVAINHIKIYRRDREVGPQVFVASQQIYASHYFNAFRMLTAFVSVPGVTDGGYLVYENRALADGLEGPFSKIKRGVVQKKALEGLKAILVQSKSSLEGQTLSAAAGFSSYQSYGWKRRLFGGIRPLLWMLMLSALVTLLALNKRRTDIATARRNKTLKPESVKS